MAVVYSTVGIRRYSPFFSFLFFCCLCLLVCLFNCEMSGGSCAQEGPKPQPSFLWLAGVC